MNTKYKMLVLALLEVFVLTFFATLAPLSVLFDIMVLGNGVGELSFTEIMQELLLLLTVSVYCIKAHRLPEARGILLLAGGFYTCMLIRELDAMFDLLFWHGSWRWLVGVTAFVTLIGVFVNRATIASPILAHIGGKAYVYETVGLVIVLIFSRTMGSGGFLWKQIIGSYYLPLMKASLQEGLELFGYTFIFYGACLFSNDNVTKCYRASPCLHMS